MTKDIINRPDYSRAIENHPAFNLARLAAMLMERAITDDQGLNVYQVALDAGKLFGLGKQLEALSLADCNVGLTPRQEKRREKIAAQAAEIASWYGLKAECYGDPRGYVLRLTGEGVRANGWGEGFGVA